MRRLCEIPAKVRSALHLLGSLSKPGWLGSLLWSILRPSLNHSLAQNLQELGHEQAVLVRRPVGVGYSSGRVFGHGAYRQESRTLGVNILRL